MPRKVLIYDRDPSAVSLIEHSLKKSGCTVVRSFTSASCIETVKTKKPEVVLLDTTFEDLDTFHVLRQIRNDPENDPVRILMLGAPHHQNRAFDAYAHGADLFLLDGTLSEILLALELI